MEVVKNTGQVNQELQDLPAGIYFVISRAAEFHTAVNNLQRGLNTKPYSDAQLLQILNTTEAVETPLQPGHYTMVHIITAVVRMEAQQIDPAGLLK